MSIISSAAPHRPAAGAVVHAAGHAMTRWWVAYINWRIERHAIARLRAMRDRLEDIGVARF